jgi:hypothetical protein
MMATTTLRKIKKFRLSGNVESSLFAKKTRDIMEEYRGCTLLILFEKERYS